MLTDDGTLLVTGTGRTSANGAGSSGVELGVGQEHRQRRPGQAPSFLRPLPQRIGAREPVGPVAATVVMIPSLSTFRTRW